MEKQPRYLLLLFAMLAVVVFLPMAQEHLKCFKTIPLEGAVEEVAKPKLSYDDFVACHYQDELERYMGQNYGFRPFTIRLYNQYQWDCFSKTNSADVVRGKDGWFYYPESVRDYYGTEMYRWQATAEQARQTYDREARLMYKLRGVLKDYDVEFLMFMAPEKGRLYPEHLPDRAFDTTTVDAVAYYEALFKEYGFPYIEMTHWFQTMKDTMPFTLIPQIGAHWGFSSVVAADSLFRFMGSLNGQQLPNLVMGPLHPSAPLSVQGNCDIGNLLNLIRPLRHDDDVLLEADVAVDASSATLKPSVLFVGNSYLWSMIYYIPFDEMFSHSEYWFYNSTAYYGKDFLETTPVPGIDVLQKVINSDYVVWFTTGAQMYKVSYGFVEKALMALCLSNRRLNEVRGQLMDSLALTHTVTDTVQLWQEANMALIADPERWFPELAGDSIPTVRNPRVYDALAFRTMDRHPATTDSIVNQLKAWIHTRPDMMAVVRQKAEAKGITEEESLDRDVRWMVADKIKKGEIVMGE